MGRFDVCVCVHFVISIMHVEDRVMFFFLNDMLRGRLVGQKEVSG